MAFPHVPFARPPLVWFGKGLLRALLLVALAALVAGFAAAFGIARDYGYMRASILTGSPNGQYHALATRLAERATRGHGTLTVIPTAGSVENVSRLTGVRCSDMFALIQDGTLVSADAQLELLGRLPAPESLFLLGRAGRTVDAFADLRGAAIGIGPDGSGTAYLMRQLFDGPDLASLDVRLSNHELPEQAQLVADGRLDVAAIVIEEDAELLRTLIGRYGLDLVSPRDLDGLIARYPWLSLGTIPSGRYDLVHPIPPSDKRIAQLDTLVVAGPCTQRADRVALLVLLGAELPGFVRANPPRATSTATNVLLASEAHQFFRTGEPELADRYFPWLVNLMSPAYWVYLVMAVTVLFNALKALSHFRLWRIDAARDKLDAALKNLIEPGLTHTQMRAIAPERVMGVPERRAAAQAIMDRLAELRARCQIQIGSLVTPMGDEMFYRYQQFLIDEAVTTVGVLLQQSQPAGDENGSVVVKLAPQGQP